MFEWLKRFFGAIRDRDQLTAEIVRTELACVLSSTLKISATDAYRRCHVDIDKEDDVYCLQVMYNNVKVKSYISNASLNWPLLNFSFIYLRPLAMMIAAKLQRPVPAQ